MAFPLPPWPCASLRGPSRCSDGTAPAPTLPCGRTGNVQTLGPSLPSRALAAAPGRTRPPLVGFVRRCGTEPRLSPRPEPGADHPSTDPVSRERVPGWIPAERPLPRASLRASVPRSQPRNPVPSAWFHTTSTVSSARRSRACCIPLPVMGFAAFRGAGFRTATRRTGSWQEDRHPPRSALHTPRRNPRQQPHHVTVAVAPVPLVMSPLDPRSAPLPAHPASSARPPRRLRGVAPPSSSGVPRPLPAVNHPVLPWALFPFEVLLTSARIRARVLCGDDGETSEDKPPDRHQAPFRTMTATVRCRPGSPPSRATNTGATHPRDPKTATVAAWTRHTAIPKDDAAPGDAAPPLPVVDASPRNPILVQDERGRTSEAVGIPSTVHRGTVGNRSSRA